MDRFEIYAAEVVFAEVDGATAAFVFIRKDDELALFDFEDAESNLDILIGQLT